MMKQFEILDAARNTMLEKLNLAENLPFTVGVGEMGDYVEVIADDGTVYNVPVTVKVTAHKYQGSERTAAYSLEDEADGFQFELDERAKKKAAAEAERARKKAEGEAAKAKREAEKAAKKAKREAEKATPKSAE